jgi:DNA-binding NtrC family response regulator
MDMHLGRGRDGLDLLEEIAGVNPLVKFLVISGRREVEVASRVVAASRTGLVSDVHIKPFTLEQLFIAVDRAVPTSGEAAARA